MIIPWQKLESSTLKKLIEDFVLREGTDYGEKEYNLSHKVADVFNQIKSGDAILVWSELYKTVNIISKLELIK